MRIVNYTNNKLKLRIPFHTTMGLSFSVDSTPYAGSAITSSLRFFRLQTILIPLILLQLLTGSFVSSYNARCYTAPQFQGYTGVPPSLRGTCGYSDALGIYRTVEYLADENGFIPQVGVQHTPANVWCPLRRMCPVHHHCPPPFRNPCFRAALPFPAPNARPRCAELAYAKPFGIYCNPCLPWQKPHPCCNPCYNPYYIPYAYNPYHGRICA